MGLAQSALTRLSAIVPPPRRHVTLYFGVLSSHSKWRNKVVPKANEEVEGSTAQNGSGEPIPAPVVETEIKSGTGPLSRYIPWHELLRRTFGSEIVCPDCGGKLKLIALVKTETTIRTILAAMHLPTGPPKVGPSRPSPGEEEELEWGEGRTEEEWLG